MMKGCLTMKKPVQFLLLLVMIASAVFTVWFPIYIWPKEVVVEFQGVMFTDGDSSEYETVSIELNGHINKKMFGGERYLGKIIIDKMDVRKEWEEQTVRINFDTKGLGVMYYLDESTADYELVPHAIVSIGDKGSSVVLSLIGDATESTHMIQGSTMIAGPADDRSAGVSIANKLMKKYLDNPIN